MPGEAGAAPGDTADLPTLGDSDGELEVVMGGVGEGGGGDGEEQLPPGAEHLQVGGAAGGVGAAGAAGEGVAAGAAGTAGVGDAAGGDGAEGRGGRVPHNHYGAKEPVLHIGSRQTDLQSQN